MDGYKTQFEFPEFSGSINIPDANEGDQAHFDLSLNFPSIPLPYVVIEDDSGNECSLEDVRHIGITGKGGFEAHQMLVLFAKLFWENPQLFKNCVEWSRSDQSELRK